VSGLMWNVAEETVSHVSSGDFVRARGKAQVYQGTIQIILTHVDPVPQEGLDPADFHPSSGHDVTQLLERLRQILLGLDDPALRTLMECFLIDEQLMQSVAKAPAGVKTHHAYHGGLLEHVVNMMEAAIRIADLYPSVDLDLLLAGILLHDLGKVREMSYEASFLYTDEGQLLGHMHIGNEILNEKIAVYSDQTGQEFPAETALRLKHMVLSHHGRYEHGSAKLPMTPEAIALHHLDNLDAKIHEFARTIEDDPNTNSHWTPFIARLDRKLFKGEAAPIDAAAGGTGVARTKKPASDVSETGHSAP
ncbi:MAG: 3'-5' exoribonuclease YhaM family protein, partial [Planctomycetaceae bacterium]